jgi:fumarylacetoacetase
MTEIDRTHDAGARSWLASANAAGCEFPVQNLPHGVFRARGGAGPFRGGIATWGSLLELSWNGTQPLALPENE